MIGPNAVIEKEFLADGALTQYRVGKKGTNENDIAQCSAASDEMFGVIQHAAADNEQVRMMLMGISKVEYGGTVAQGDKLTVDANGRAIKATRHDHVENSAGTYTQSATTGVGSDVNIIGIAMTGGVLSDTGSVLLMPAYS